MPPFFIKTPTNQTFFAGPLQKYILPNAKDPEGGPLKINVLSNLGPYIDHSGGFDFLINAPLELAQNLTFKIEITLDDQVHAVPYSFTIRIITSPKIKLCLPANSGGQPFSFEQILLQYQLNPYCLKLQRFQRIATEKKILKIGNNMTLPANEMTDYKLGGAESFTTIDYQK